MKKLLLTLMLMVTPGAKATADVTVNMVPADTTVAPGATFDVRMVIPLAGSVFNGYEGVVEFDRTKLEPITMSPLDDQQGSLMLSVCGFCYHRWYLLPSSAAPDSVKMTHVTMCGVPPHLTGPGVLYRMRFRVKPGVQNTTATLSFRRLQFTSGGFHVTPVNRTGATIHVAASPPPPCNDCELEKSGMSWTTIKKLYQDQD